MSDNVIILGAGASLSAGIPLLSGFMDKMWELAKLGRHNGVNISPEDRNLLVEALAVRDELDGYHGRAALDVWNLEEVLSLLSFNSLGGGRTEKRKFELVTKAIAKTIEMTCKVKHSGDLRTVSLDGTSRVPLYENFWHGLFAWCVEKRFDPPVILTFNYDLVLERALLHATIGTQYRIQAKFPSSGIVVDYHTKVIDPVALRFEAVEFYRNDDVITRDRGWVWAESGKNQTQDDLTKINLLKLHGSNNFPKQGRNNLSQSDPGLRLARALDDPLILPPVFNKATETVGSEAWAYALNALRSCKNLIVCGYSLPQSDIYMQYFLKAALGPNQDLNRIFVFDPVLFRADQKADGDALKQRYGSNFADPIQRRINYMPPIPPSLVEEQDYGTMEHVVQLLVRHPETILFG